MPLDGDAKKFTETKLEPFTLEHFAAWLATKPRAETYERLNPRICALGQYTTENGGLKENGLYRIGKSVLATSAFTGDITTLHFVAYQCDDHEATFGAAHDRALNLLAWTK